MSDETDKFNALLRADGVEVPEAERSRLRIVESDEVPRIQLPCGGRNISTFARELALLLRDAGAFFVRDGEVVAVDRSVGSPPALVPLNPRNFRVDVEAWVTCYQVHHSQKGALESSETMGLETAATVLASRAFKDELHEVRRLHDQRLPVLRADGRVERLEPGLDVEAGVYTMPESLDYRLDMPIETARHLWREWFSEFPFCDWEGDWQTGKSRSFSVHTMAALSQFAWCLVSDAASRLGFLWHSNSERSGKSLLAQICLAITHGLFASSSWKKDEEKMAALLDVIVRNRASYAFFDNLKGHLSSEEFEGFMTGAARKVRLFHTQIERIFPNRTSCFITGNTLTWSKDIDGRVLISDLYLEDADPQGRKIRNERTWADFLEPGLRGDVLAALWAFVREWDAAGRQSAPRVRAGFGEWCRVMGGIVIAQGFGDPLAPRPEELSGGNTDYADMLALVERMATGIQQMAEYKFEDVVEAALAVNAFEWLMKGKEKRIEGEDRVRFILDPSERRKFSDILSSTYGGRTFVLADGRKVKWGSRGKNRGRRYLLTIVAQAAA